MVHIVLMVGHIVLVGHSIEHGCSSGLLAHTGVPPVPDVLSLSLLVDAGGMWSALSCSRRGREG